MHIPKELEGKIDEVITHYPVSKRSAALPLLHLMQEHFGCIPKEAVPWIAQKLEIQPINIFELVTFYPMFRQKMAGTNHIRVCRTLSCAMAGAYELMDKMCKAARIDRSQSGGHGNPIAVSKDGKYSIEFVECLASCGFGPVCMINDDFYESVNEEEVPKILEKYA